MTIDGKTLEVEEDSATCAMRITYGAESEKSIVIRLTRTDSIAIQAVLKDTLPPK